MGSCLHSFWTFIRLVHAFSDGYFLLFLSLSLSLSLSLYIYIYIYIYTHTHIYIHINIKQLKLKRVMIIKVDFCLQKFLRNFVTHNANFITLRIITKILRRILCECNLIFIKILSFIQNILLPSNCNIVCL